MTMPDELDPERVARLRDAARRLPEEVEPAHDLWPAIRALIEAGRVQSLPVADPARGSAPHADAGMRDRGSAPDAVRLPWYARPRRLAAAAVLLIAVTATSTWFATARRTAPPTSTASHETTVLPAADLAEFASYEASAADLAQALETRRAKLDPATVAAIEGSLRTIDSALVAARAALAKDPGSAQVRAYVEAAYRQKLDFLRRANDVAATWTL